MCRATMCVAIVVSLAWKDSWRRGGHSPQHWWPWPSITTSSLRGEALSCAISSSPFAAGTTVNFRGVAIYER